MFLTVKLALMGCCPGRGHVARSGLKRWAAAVSVVLPVGTSSGLRKRYTVRSQIKDLSRGYTTAGFNANFIMGNTRTGLAQGFDFYEVWNAKVVLIWYGGARHDARPRGLRSSRNA
jgi:hypothetical protein